MALHRLSPQLLQARLRRAPALLLLDVRRSEAFKQGPAGIAGAVPLLLDEATPSIPDLPRTTPVVVYCLCSGQASSTRVALWLQAAGYQDVSVLEGGLPAWEDAGLPLAAIAASAQRPDIAHWIPAPRALPSGAGRLIAEQAFLSGIELPARRLMAVLFVDMVDSTQLLFSKPPQEVMRLVQAFMEVVVDVTVQHCGDVHDFEGDGAMLYFAGPGEAVPAAFNLRQALAARRHCEPALPLARFALDAGPLVVGYVGTHERRALSFIGPCVNAAARILKLATPNGIVATDHIVREASRTNPDLARRFQPLPGQQTLKGWPHPVTVHLAGDDAAA